MMSGDSITVKSWMLDSSTFINTIVVDQVMLMVSLRSPLFFPEYVFRFELGVNAKEKTHNVAMDLVNRKRIGVQQLTLADLDRLSHLAAPRRIGLGELACAIIAERSSFGILCDDWRAKASIEARITTILWDSIEGFLLEAAERRHIGESELEDFQRKLETNHYHCRCELRMEYLRRLLHGRTQ
jgi:hypothetical protein